ncbi:MAG: hypothetical protein LAN37_05485 [Acidobacteriia bacterium]|nr:hypothetical protein [Terriglobia bacterium]
MLTPTFRFFEAICSELSATESRVITGRDFEAKLGDAPLLAELREEHHSPSSFEAMRSAVDFLAKHFEERGSTLPFVYDHESGRFTAGDIDFINFIESMASIRSRGVHAQQFEIGVAEKLLRRTTGAIHRVGHPRTRNKKRAEFNAYLKGLGFRPEVLLGRKEKDGGLDILWMLPIGAIPHKPIVSVQCKNAVLKEIDIERPPTGTTSASLACHSRFQPQVHVYCVFFNDYIDSQHLPVKQMNFVPLGLSDLGDLVGAPRLEVL